MVSNGTASYPIYRTDTARTMPIILYTHPLQACSFFPLSYFYVFFFLFLLHLISCNSHLSHTRVRTAHTYIHTHTGGVCANIYFYEILSNKKYTYLNAEEKPRCLATRSRTKTSFPCSCKRNVFASTSRKIRLKCSLSTRNRWQLFSFSTIVAALYLHRWHIHHPYPNKNPPTRQKICPTK